MIKICKNVKKQNFLRNIDGDYTQIRRHSGRTNTDGWHYDTENAATLGPYHWHHGVGPHKHECSICKDCICSCNSNHSLLDILLSYPNTSIETNIDKSKNIVEFKAKVPISRNCSIILDTYPYLAGSLYTEINYRKEFVKYFFSEDISPKLIEVNSSSWEIDDKCYDFLVKDYFLDFLIDLIEKLGIENKDYGIFKESTKETEVTVENYDEEYVEDDRPEVDIFTGFNEVDYIVEVEGRVMPTNLYIFKTDPNTMSIAPGLSSEKLEVYNINPLPSICEPNQIILRTNANYLDNRNDPDYRRDEFDLDKDGNTDEYIHYPFTDEPINFRIKFYGIFLTTDKYGNKVLSKDGFTDIDLNEIENNYLIKYITEYGIGDYLGGWSRNSPSLCINDDDSAKIHWISYDKLKDYNTITLQEAYSKYKTIISGQHCLVYKGQSVFESGNLIRSDEGIIIADYDDIKNTNYHYNDVIGGRWAKTRRARTLLGHTYDNSFIVATAKGYNDHTNNKIQYGFTLQMAARMMCDLGCDFALNMDGGSPTQMYGNWDGKNYNYINTEGMQVGSTLNIYQK